MITQIRRHPILAFQILALLIATAAIQGAIADPALIPDLIAWEARTASYPTIIEPWQFALDANRPRALLIALFAAAPTIAAIIVCAADGRNGLRYFATHLLPARAPLRRAALLYSVLLAIIAAGAVLLHGIAAVAGNDALAAFGSSAVAVTASALIFALTDIGGVSEELGWRGFVQPKLTGGCRSAAAAALLVGLLWWSWHLPRDLALIYPNMELTDFLRHELVFAVTLVCISVVCAAACNLVGGVIWPAVLIHGGANVWSTIGGAALGDSWSYANAGVHAALAAICLIGFGPNLGARRPRAE